MFQLLINKINLLQVKLCVKLNKFIESILLSTAAPGIFQVLNYIIEVCLISKNNGGLRSVCA